MKFCFHYLKKGIEVTSVCLLGCDENAGEHSANLRTTLLSHCCNFSLRSSTNFASCKQYLLIKIFKNKKKIITFTAIIATLISNEIIRITKLYLISYRFFRWKLKRCNNVVMFFKFSVEGVKLCVSSVNIPFGIANTNVYL